MAKPTILFGVHNGNYNMDFYSDNTIEITQYKGKILAFITTFNEEMVSVFIASLKQDGHIDKLLEINKERIEKLGFGKYDAGN